ncbi:MAG TPA: ferritin-like domain-containing protein [Ignavibacteriaceae bacterium]
MKDNKEIISNLVKSYWMEIETVMNYISNSVNLDGVRAEEIKKSLSIDILEEINHAQLLAKRIKELGGSVPGSMELKAEQKYLQTLKDTTDVVSVIEGVIQAEEGAVKQYNKLIKLCEGKDYVTQDLCIRLLGMEESHRIEFKGFLKEYKK